MDINVEKYCVVCFRVLGSEYEVIDDGTGIMLYILRVELNWDSSEDLYLCQECINIMRKSYDFKQISSDSINRYWARRNRLRSGQKSAETDISEEYTTCVLCRSRVKSDTILSIDVLLNNPNIMELYSWCMADIDLKDIKGILVCTTCKESFEAYFNFVHNYLKIIEKVKAYLKNQSFDGNLSQEILKKINIFLFETPIESSSLTEAEELEEGIEDFEAHEAPCDSLRHQETDIENETVIVNDENRNNNEEVVEPITSNLQTDEHNLSPISNKVCRKRESNSNIKRELRILIQKDSFGSNTSKNNTYTYKTKTKVSPKPHRMSHSGQSKEKMYKCESSPIKDKHIIVLPTHTLPNKINPIVRTFKCKICPYESKRKEGLRVHLLSHKSNSEVEMYKCESCEFETKYKYTLKRHNLTHERKSRVKTFKCDSCRYETSRKYNLMCHVQSHRRDSEVKTYKCKECTFETRFKSGFRSHLSSHMRSPKDGIFKCGSCEFTTKRKGHLLTHMLTHKKPSEVEMYKCKSCKFETKYKHTLKRHDLTHKRKSEVKMYRCEVCLFECNRKDNFKTHQLTHEIDKT